MTDTQAQKSLTATATAYVVDDDDDVRSLIERILAPTGMRVLPCARAVEFLEVYDTEGPACLVLDVRLPGMTRPQLHTELIARKISLPVIMVSGSGDLRTAVQSIKAGAIDFIEKPLDSQTLLRQVDLAIDRDVQN